jgi:hypothetical protein
MVSVELSGLLLGRDLIRFKYSGIFSVLNASEISWFNSLMVGKKMEDGLNRPVDLYSAMTG